MNTMMSNTMNLDIDTTRLNDDDYITEKCLIRKNKYDTTILKFNRDHLTEENVGSLGLFRSVIVHNDAIVSVAPPKAHSIETFKNKYNTDELFSKLTFEEYVEGTMINVYYNGSDWEIASRSMVGAQGQFYKGSKTFRRMFLEAMNTTSLEFDYLNKEYCYSFVFQHPENRIVVCNKDPKLYLCAVYKISGTNVEEINFRNDKTLCSHVNVPEQYDTISSWEDLYMTFANTESTPYYVMGVVIKDGMMRSKIRNPNYSYVKELRGNQPKLQFQYFHLRKLGRVTDYLKYYPEHSDQFKLFRKQIHTFTQNLHSFYVKCYCLKEKPLKEYPTEYRTHMYYLHHDLYLPKLREEGKKVTIYEVMTYVNNIEPARLMFSINFKLRTSNKKVIVDEIKAATLDTKHNEIIESRPEKIQG